MVEKLPYLLGAVVAAAIAAWLMAISGQPTPEPVAAPTESPQVAEQEPAKENERAPTVREVKTTTINVGSDSAPAPVLTALPLEDPRLSSGCGLFLSLPGNRDTVVFFADVVTEEGQTMTGWIGLDGAVVKLRRTVAQGDSLGFGVHPRQTFESEDGNLKVAVSVTMGAPPEPEDVPVEEGALTVMKAGHTTVRQAIEGGAGC